MASHRTGAAHFDRLEERLFLSATVLISEFLASNDDGLRDADGDASDWIELYNPTASAVDLDGWYLTDDPELSDLWRIPAITLPAGGYKVIFASDKDRDDPAAELHTDFKLSASGEYLALVMPDGATVAHDYAPEFPRQLEDVSYGLNLTGGVPVSERLIAEGDAATLLFPTAANWDAGWMNPAFNDSAWAAGSSAIGYETDVDDDTSYVGYYQTDTLSAMYDANTGALLRIPFTVENVSEILSMTLALRYDDGFVAYLNGVQVASANAPATLGYNAAASASHSDSAALLAVEFDLGAGLGALVEGPNVLAIHALNAGTTSSDFLCAAELFVERPGDEAVSQEYFAEPTPGALNIPGTLGFVKDTKFSVDRGFFDTPFELVISCDTPDAEIRYTLDGSTPTATHGAIYTGPLVIDGHTVLRAAAFKTGFTPSEVDAQTYIFLDEVLTQPDLPAGYPTTWDDGVYTRPGDYGMDPEIVDDAAYAEEFEAAFTVIPTVSITTDIANLFDADTGIYVNAIQSGLEWERACTVEYFTADGSDEFTINCGLRMRGGASRSQRTTPKHSFRLIFRDIYGAGKLDYDIFGPDATDSFDTLILRAGSNLSWPHHNGWPVYTENRQYAMYIRDQWAKDAQMAMGWDSCHHEYVHLYLNGIYWGLYDLGERPSAPFASDYDGGEKEQYDVINSGEAIDGDLTAWNEMMALSQQNMANSANYQALGEMLNLEAFSDYMILNQFGGNIDWDHHNWQAYRNRDGGQWYFVMWDTEIIFVNLQENRIDPTRFGALEPSSSYNASENVLTRMWLNLLDNPEYRVMFADRLHEHLFNDGLLTPDAMIESWAGYVEEIYSPILCESARWGDYRRDVYYAGRSSFDDHQLYDRDEEWLEEYRRLVEDYFPYRTDVVIQQYQNYGVYPSLAAPDYGVDGEASYGGAYAPGETLAMSGPGAIYFTLDGSDPRLPGGSLNPQAVLYTGPISLAGNLTVKARAYSGGAWSALSNADYVQDASAAIVISEVNYHPTAPTPTELAAGITDDDAFEFIELYNPTAQAASLAALSLSGGLAFDFSASAISAIPAGGYVLVVRDQAAFELRYGTGLPVAGEFTGGLNNASDTIVLDYGEGGRALAEFTYRDDGDWPGRPDGDGATLVFDDPAADPSDPDSWRGSLEYLGSPGAAAAMPATDVVVNEVLTHTDLPQVDAIELYNPTASAIDISGWWLSDSSGNYRKFQIPAGTILAAGGYIVFTEYDFNPSGIDEDPSNDAPGDFGLDGAHGDRVWLMAADASGRITRFVDDVKFDAAANGKSFARLPNGSGALAVSEPSLGLANVSPVFGPVVVSEIMYNPAGLPSVPGVVLVDEDFAADAGAFAYVSSPFGQDTYNFASGSVQDGHAQVAIQASGFVGHFSGGWQAAFQLDQPGTATLTFAFEGWGFGLFDAGDVVQIIAAVDGQRVGSLAGGASAIIDGSTQPGAMMIEIGRTEVQVQVDLAAGSHTLTLGVAGDYTSGIGGQAEAKFDAVRVESPGDSDHLEYIELTNVSTGPVDLTGWRIRGGADFDFDDGVVIAPGERVVLVDFDPDLPGGAELLARFRSAYGLDASTRVLGRWFGSLSNGGEALTLQRPDEPPLDEPDYTPMLTVDQVRFNDVSPWPAAADGQGLALTRVTGSFGRLGSAWAAAAPTPGSGVILPQGDFNADGRVDIDDFVILKQHYNQSTPGLSVNVGDANGDGVVNIDDFVILKRNYNTAAAGVAGVASVAGVSDVAGVGGDEPEGGDEPAPVFESVDLLSATPPLPVDRAVKLAASELWLTPPDEI